MHPTKIFFTYMTLYIAEDYSSGFKQQKEKKRKKKTQHFEWLRKLEKHNVNNEFTIFASVKMFIKSNKIRLERSSHS